MPVWECDDHQAVDLMFAKAEASKTTCDVGSTKCGVRSAKCGVWSESAEREGGVRVCRFEISE